MDNEMNNNEKSNYDIEQDALGIVNEYIKIANKFAGDNYIYDTSSPRSHAPVMHKPSLQDKGLTLFEINGYKIYAHNQKEAEKRYRSRIKSGNIKIK